MDSNCLLFLAPSTIPEAGRGLFAGSHIAGNLTFMEDLSLLLTSAHGYMGGLRSYVVPVPDTDHVTLHFGPGNFINSASHGQTHYGWLLGDAFANSRSLSTNAQFFPRAGYSNEALQPGQEIFSSTTPTLAGSQKYGKAYLDVAAERSLVGLETLLEVGVCLSDVYVAESTVSPSSSHRGLFTKRSFRKDDLITVSPVLVLRMKHIEATKGSSVLLNYIITEKGASVGLLPLGHAAMINHADRRIPHAKEANVFVAWHDWSAHVHGTAEDDGDKSPNYAHSCISKDSSIEHLLVEPLESLILSPFALLDLAYYATRDIAVGEEVLMDYGVEWQHHMTKCIEAETGNFIPDNACLRFRHAIEVPRGLFPAHWHP